MLDIFWDLFQHKQISNLQHGRISALEKERAQDVKAEDIDDRLRELERRHEQLKLVTLALWSLLRDHSGLLESDLRKYVEQIDLLDGKRDGKVSHATEKATCTGCSRTLLATSSVCVYCGTALPRAGMFKGA